MPPSRHANGWRGFYGKEGQVSAGRRAGGPAPGRRRRWPARLERFYKRYRAQYDVYRALIQPGVTVAGVPVGWLSPEEARAKVMETVAAPYYQDFTLLYQDQPLTLSPEIDLAFDIPVTDMVDEAMAASHQYDYWKGFWRWLKGSVETLTLDSRCG